MNTASLKTKFEAMGARLKVGELRPRRWQRLNDLARFTVDIKTDKRGEFFELLVRPDAEPDFQDPELRPAGPHPLLFAKMFGRCDDIAHPCSFAAAPSIGGL